MRNTVNYNNKIRNDYWDERVLKNKRRRKRELQKRILQLLFAAAFICISTLSVNGIVSKAGAAKEEELSFKYYKNISVKQGETLESIASIYADEQHYKGLDKYVQEVMFINHIEEDETIFAGDYLIIPYYSNELLE